MADISNVLSQIKIINFYLFYLNSPGFVARGPTDNKSALVQIMAWQWSGDKPVPAPMLPMFYDAIYDCGLMTQYGDIDLSQHCLR